MIHAPNGMQLTEWDTWYAMQQEKFDHWQRDEDTNTNRALGPVPTEVMEMPWAFMNDSLEW